MVIVERFPDSMGNIFLGKGTILGRASGTFAMLTTTTNEDEGGCRCCNIRANYMTRSQMYLTVRKKTNVKNVWPA